MAVVFTAIGLDSESVTPSNIYPFHYQQKEKGIRENGYLFFLNIEQMNKGKNSRTEEQGIMNDEVVRRILLNAAKP
jgi:hypothetical protein